MTTVDIIEGAANLTHTMFEVWKNIPSTQGANGSGFADDLLQQLYTVAQKVASKQVCPHCGKLVDWKRNL